MTDRARLRLIKAAPVTRTADLTRASDALLSFIIAFVALVVTHVPLLTLPYYWDEAGYYIPAARDLLLTGDPIPHSTVTNPHPPLVIAWLAGTWKVFGYSPLVAHLAMLVFAALAVAGVFHLARRVAHREVAFAAAALTFLYPVFFAQATLAQLDVAAMAFTLWGLLFYLEDRKTACVVAFSLAALTKETAILAPLALLAWEVVCYLRAQVTIKDSPEGALRSPLFWANVGKFPPSTQLCPVLRDGSNSSLFLLVPLAPLFGWMMYQYGRTGHLLGNAEFARYNLGATLSPTRFLLALVQRLWQLAGHMDLYVLTAATLLAMFFPALPERHHGRVVEMPDETPLRQRISIATQLAFGAVALAYVLALSLIGGAVLARYLLPVIPLLIVICVSTLRRRVFVWKWVVATVAAGFCIALFINPPYRFAPEDNLAFRDYVRMHQRTAGLLRRQYPGARVLTAWPASDELTRPWLGYVDQPLRVVRLENFSVAEIAGAARRDDYDVALVFSTKYQPPNGSPLDWIPWWRRAHEKYFDFHQDLPPELVAQWLHGDLVYSEHVPGQWIGIVTFGRVQNASSQRPERSAGALPNELMFRVSSRSGRRLAARDLPR